MGAWKMHGENNIDYYAMHDQEFADDVAPY